MSNQALEQDPDALVERGRLAGELRPKQTDQLGGHGDGAHDLLVALALQQLADRAKQAVLCVGVRRGIDDVYTVYECSTPQT